VTAVQHDHGCHTASQQDRCQCRNQHRDPQPPGTALVIPSRIRVGRICPCGGPFFGTWLRGTRSRGTWLRGTHFRGIRLRGIRLRGVQLWDIGFRLGCADRPEGVKQPAPQMPVAAQTAAADHHRRRGYQHR
jgi:hypothetical protein